MVHCMLKTNVGQFFCLKHRLFEIQPRAKQVFGFDKGEADGQARADVHARAFAGVFDSVFQMLGPDQEFIEEMLKQIGKRHKAMGVLPFHGTRPDRFHRRIHSTEIDWPRKRSVGTCF